ncbi:hypothetical protein EJ08DRAFT_54204 [Tothia fuscella]|uniref:Uncharacterized protein n=1 Tax=Tothia fuscella TaxID=1048955 RepID=A0A9P4TT62_9PEZI|nr:hypothetical protein EJ08DRAFT_54204 [Tothia fuscella]
MTALVVPSYFGSARSRPRDPWIDFYHYPSTAGDASHPTSTYATCQPVINATMNWTGGRLQRHQKNSGNTAANRQKQHFAKVRQQLQNGEVQSEAPLAHRLASIKERSSLSPTYTSAGKDLKARDTLPSSGLPAQSSHDISRQSLDTRKSRVKSHASSPSSGLKKRLIHQSTEDSCLESSKKRLLSQYDWVGLAPTRPLQMRFSSHQDKERIGKRRKIDRKIQARRARLCDTKDQIDHTNNQLQRGPFMNSAAAVSPESISVRIGPDANASQMTVTQHKYSVAQSMNDRLSSDTMLFDVEEIQEPESFELRSQQEVVEQVDGEVSRKITPEEELYNACVPAFDTNPFFLDSRTKQHSGQEAKTVQDHKFNAADQMHIVGVDDEIGDLLNQINTARSPYAQSPFDTHRKSHSDSLSQDVCSIAHAEYLTQTNKTRELSPQYAKLLSSPFIYLTRGSSEEGTNERDDQTDIHWQRYLPAPSQNSASSPEFRTANYNELASHSKAISSKSDSMIPQGAASTQRATESRYGMASSVQVRQSPSASLRHILNHVGQHYGGSTVAQPKPEDHDELWKKFVFGSDDGSEPLNHEEVKRYSVHPANKPANSALSLVVRPSTSSSSRIDQPSLASLCPETTHSQPSSHVSQARHVVDRSAHQIINPAASDAAHASRLAADPEGWRKQSSYFQNKATYSGSLSSDKTIHSLACATQGSDFDSIRRSIVKIKASQSQE